MSGCNILWCASAKMFDPAFSQMGSDKTSLAKPQNKNETKENQHADVKKKREERE